MTETSVTLLYHSMVCDIEYINGRINSVEVCGKSGKRRIEAKIFVDASGDCDIAFLAGLVPNNGREGDGKCQPMTMNFKVINVVSSSFADELIGKIVAEKGFFYFTQLFEIKNLSPFNINVVNRSVEQRMAQKYYDENISDVD